jgi:energy-coupling factor transporter ATP-binding protein EcfA2
MTRFDSGYRMIHSAEIRNFRCFKQLSIDKCRRFNVIVGDNGSGKTALLEAIFLALASSPSIALRYRTQRGLESTFGGALHVIEEALWRDLFYRGIWDSPISIVLKGDGQENRSVLVSRGAQTEIPFSEAGQLEGRVAGIQFRWVNAANKELVFIPKVSPTGLALGEAEEEILPDFFYFAANQTITAGENADRFSELSRSGKIPEFIDAVRREYAWITNLNIEIVARTPIIYATLDTGDRLPLANVSGGVNRIISFMLALASRKRAVLCIDEIEDGVYYKHQHDVWNILTSTARQQEAQLFLTTHNEEWLEAVFENENTDDVALWRLVREDGMPRLRQFTGKQISAAIRTDGEIR